MSYSLLSFLRRRVFIDVSPRDIVLDVGSGDKPSWRADVLLDAYPSDQYSQQREGGGAAIIDRRWFVLGDAELMPFRDKSFDYVICSHLLEHVIHPDKAIQELQRVAKRGYIETPFEGAQKLSDFPTHLWYVHLDNEKLVFTAKQSRGFDPYIDILMQTMIKNGLWDKFQSRFFDCCIVEKYWRDQIPHEVRGELSEPYIREVSILRVEHDDGAIGRFEKTLRLLFFIILNSIHKILYDKSRIEIENLIRCCRCGGEKFDSVSDGYKCVQCQEIITILGGPGTKHGGNHMLG